MSKPLFTLLTFFSIASVYSQSLTNRYGKIDVAITKEKKPRRIYAEVEIITPFIGGDSAWVRALENSINQSVRPERRIKKGRYIVSAVFIVAKDSTLSDVRCLKDPGFGLGETVMRALKKGVGARWRPAPYPVKEIRSSSTTPPTNN